jgi:hypothetical protein
MRGDLARFGALFLLLALLGCASVEGGRVVVVDASTEVPAVIWVYGHEGDLGVAPYYESMPSQAIEFAAWSDGRLICRGDGGFEGDLGRVQIDATSVAAAAEAIAGAIESVPIERRVCCMQGRYGWAITVSWKGRILQLAFSGDPEPTAAMNEAFDKCEAALFGLIPEHARHANPPAPNFDVLDPASVRFEKTNLSANR